LLRVAAVFCIFHQNDGVKFHIVNLCLTAAENEHLSLQNGHNSIELTCAVIPRPREPHFRFLLRKGIDGFVEAELAASSSLL